IHPGAALQDRVDRSRTRVAVLEFARGRVPERLYAPGLRPGSYGVEATPYIQGAARLKSSALLSLGAYHAAGLRGVMVGHFFLVLLQAPVELVGEQVDRRIHVLIDRLGMNRGATHM